MGGLGVDRMVTRSGAGKVLTGLRGATFRGRRPMSAIGTPADVEAFKRRVLAGRVNRRLHVRH